MIKVTVIAVGKIKEKGLLTELDEYKKRLKAFCDFEVVEIKPAPLPENPNEAQISSALASEEKTILDKVPKGFSVYPLCIEGKSLSSERHGENFFEQAKKETIQGIYDEDKNIFASLFTKEKILKELDNQGTFALAYRMNEDSKVFYVNMKIMRMSKTSDHIVIGINNIDSQMKQKALLEKAQKDQVIFSRLMSLSGDFIGMYIVDLETEEYTEYRATSDFEKLGLAKQGENFFERTHKNAEKTIFPEDLQKFKGEFTKENIMKEIAQKGVFTVHYRLLIDGEPKPASTRIALVKENGENKLIVGIRV